MKTDSGPVLGPLWGKSEQEEEDNDDDDDDIENDNDGMGNSDVYRL